MVDEGPVCEVVRNHTRYKELEGLARSYYLAKQYEAAIGFARVAANFATHHHSGIFSSNTLESILNELSHEDKNRHPHEFCPKQARHCFSKILHVATEISSIGGHTAMLLRWLGQDAGRSHSLALTNQRRRLPTGISALIKERDGAIFFVGERTGGQLLNARHLRSIAVNFDLVVLHIHSDDPVPILAFACSDGRPPVALIDHADHAFWLGVSISDLVVGLRSAGVELAISRRGVCRSRTCLLPIPVDIQNRTVSRSVAKAALGLQSTSFVLVCVARAVKFNKFRGEQYIDMFVPFLNKYNNANLLIIGPGEKSEWDEKISHFGGRIRVFSETSNTKPYFEAADVCVDSFPFVSNTSLLEGGSFGNPIVTRSVCGEMSSVLDCDMPGVEKVIIRVDDAGQMTTALTLLLEDSRRRAELGCETQRDIQQWHDCSSWREKLELFYERCTDVCDQPRSLPCNAVLKTGLLDTRVLAVHGRAHDGMQYIRVHLRFLPFRYRLQFWHKINYIQSLKFSNLLSIFLSLLPNWLLCRIARRVRV